MKINEQLVKYEAVLILRKATGWGAKRITKVLNELGFSIPLSTVNSYLYLDRAPRTTSPLIKSLFHHNAYKLALKLKEENPEWGCKRIKTEIKRRLGIWIPPTTIYGWINRRRKPNIVPLKICSELGYVIGTLMTDCTCSSMVRLKVRDKDYAEAFVNALNMVTGKVYKVKENGGFFIVMMHGSVLRYIVKSGLWRVIAYLYPKAWLQGLFDGDGGVGVSIGMKKEFRVVVTLTNSNISLLLFVKQLLERIMTIQCSLYLCLRKGERTRISVPRRDCWELRIERQEDIIKFYKNIGFRIQRKQKKLKDTVEIVQKYKSSSKRVEAWLKKYVKRNGKWVPSPPLLFISLMLFSLVLSHSTIFWD